MEKKKKLRGRAKRASYFVQTASGEYVYQGPLYAARPRGRLRPQTALSLRWAMGLVSAALWVMNGFLPVHGMLRTWYVLLPYAAGLVCGVTQLWAVGKMGIREKPLREYVYESAAALPARSAAAAACSLLTAIGEGVSLAVEGLGGGTAAAAVIFLLSQGVIAVLSVFWFLMEKGFDWEKLP